MQLSGRAGYVALMGALAIAPHRPPAGHRSDRAAAEAIIHRALAAMGGEDRWRAVSTIELAGRGLQNHVGDSEWFDGPFFVDYRSVVEWRDVTGIRRAARTTITSALDTASYVARSIASLGGTTQLSGDSASPSVSHLAPDTLALLLAPERVLWTALAAPDLTTEADTTFRFARHNTVAFHVGRTPVRIYFEAETGFPQVVESRQAFRTNIFWTVWGDVTERIRYAGWSLEATGIRYPRQIDVERNGLPVESVSYTDLRVNGPLPVDLFARDSAHATVPCGFGCLPSDSLPLGVGGSGGVSATASYRGPHEIAPGVVQVVGGWNATLIHQPDGVVVIEAPISAGYSRQVIAEAGRRFPGSPIKAVVTSTDFWWHVAGIREYIARGIPIYLLDRNVRLISALARATHTLVPDSLARAPRAAILRPINARITIGQGDNRVELIPFHTEALDRMLMAYLPGRRIAYTAEGVQLYPFGLSFPETAMEAVAATQREGLAIDTFIGMHVPATPWTRLTGTLDSIAAARGLSTSKDRRD